MLGLEGNLGGHQPSGGDGSERDDEAVPRCHHPQWWEAKEA